MDNVAVSRILREIADLLEIKDDNPFKIRAYRNAADITSNHPHELALLDETGLREIPGIGKDLAAKIREITATGDAAFHRAGCLTALRDVRAAAAVNGYLGRYPRGRHAAEAQRLRVGATAAGAAETPRP